jgi:hypothetical protein
MGKTPNPNGMTPNTLKRPIYGGKKPRPGGMGPSPVKGGAGFYHPHGPLFGR